MPLNHSSRFADLTTEQYAALGRVVVEWSNIEYLLGVLLSRLLRTPEYLGRTYADGLSAVRLQAAIDEAIAIHRHRYGARRVGEETLSRAAELNTRVTRLRSERNKISHFCWTRSNDEELFGSSLSGGVPDAKWQRRTSKTLTLSELGRIHEESFAIAEELMQLVDSLPEVEE